MESSEYSKYVNLPFYGEMDDSIMKPNEIDSISMSQYINDSSRNDVETLGGLDVNSFDNGNQFTSNTRIASEGWDSSTHIIHENVQNNNPQLALINPVAAGSQYLTDSTFMDQPGQSLKVQQQGHSYGTRYANQLRPTPGIEPRRRKIPKEKNEPEDKGPYCICQGPSYGTMIICDYCNEYHIRCVNLTKQQAKEIEKYMCPNCQGSRTLKSLIQEDRPIVETKSIDPKALMIEEPKQIEPPSSPKCKLQHCTEKARDNNPYCSNKCFIQGHILEIKKSQDTELVQNQPEPSVAESKKTPRVILPKLKSPAIKKAVSIPTKSGSIHNKAQTTSSSDNRPKIRSVFPEKLKGVFTNKYTELVQDPDYPEKDKNPHELGLQLANEIEDAIFHKFAKGIIGQDYKTKVRSLITSLNDPKNANLLRRILFGDIPPETLVMMSSEELANPEQKALMAKVRRESLQRSILKHENTGPRIKTTHKGELIIVENVRDSPQDSPKDTTTYFEDNSPTYANFSAPAVERPKIKFEDLVPKKWIDDNIMASKNESSEGNQLAQIVNSPLISPSVSSVNSPMHSPPNLSCQYSPGSPSEMRFESPGTPIGTPPSSNMNIVPETVWRGKLVFDKKLGEFSGHADLLAAKKRDKKRNWDEYLASSIIVNGHVSKIEDVDNYLVDCWCSPNKDIAIIKFDIGENHSNEEFENIFNSLHYAPKSAEIKKRRYGRVAPAYSTVRDMYLISLEPDDKLPDVITFLELDGILSLEKRPTRLLLGAVIIVEAESNKTKRIHDINEINGRTAKKEKSETNTTANLAKVIALPNIGSNIHNNESIQTSKPPTASSISSSTSFWTNQHNSANGTTVTTATIPAFLQSSLTTNNQNHPNLNINVSQGIQQTPLAQPLPMITTSTNELYGLSSYPPNPPNPPMIPLQAPQNYPMVPPSHQQWMPPIQPPQHPQQQVFLSQQGPSHGQSPFMPPPSNIQQPNVQYGHHVISDGVSQQQPIRQQMPIGSSSQYNAYPQNFNHSQYESPRPQSREKDNRPNWNRDNRPNLDRDRNRHNRPRRIVREDRRHHETEDYRPPTRDPRRPSPPSSDYRDFKRGGGRGG
ncbi:1552_t:CDS:2, partial [Funneliformis geosporum]